MTALHSLLAMHTMLANPMEAVMTSLTIRNLEPPTKAKLRVRAAEHGHSMEQEARQILKAALNDETAPKTHLADAIRRIFEPLGGVELDIPPRELGRDPPDFS
jgi:antitoxin FitA